MPTNVLRARRSAKRSGTASARGSVGAGRGTDAHSELAALPARNVRLRTGSVELRLTLAATSTALHIWRALPLFSSVEPWGDCVHFEIPLHLGRDRTAKRNAVAGEVYLWADDDRVVLPWGPTPISRPGEIRLMQPCNVWATVEGPIHDLAGVTPGQRITLERIDDEGA